MAVEKKQTNKEKTLERMRKSNPDRNYDDEEELFGQVNDDYDRQEEALTKANETSGRLNDLLSKDPRSAAFLSAWHEGKNPVLSFIEEYGQDIVEDLQNPDNKAKIEESSKKYLERLAKSKELDEAYAKNIEESRMACQELEESGEYSPEQIDASLQFLSQICMDFITGKVTRESIIAGIKAQGYDDAVSTADAEGEIRGRNATIAKSRKMAGKGDGLPSASGGGSRTSERPVRDDLGAIGRFGSGGRKSIWDEE